MKPTQILAKLCKDAKFDLPQYGLGTVKVGSKTFTVHSEVETDTKTKTRGKYNGISLLVFNYNLLFPRTLSTSVWNHRRTVGSRSIATMGRNAKSGL